MCEHTVTAPAGTSGLAQGHIPPQFPLVYGLKVCFSPSHQQPLHAQLRVGAGTRLQLEQLPALCLLRELPQGQENSGAGQEPVPPPRSTGSRSPACTARAHLSPAMTKPFVPAALQNHQRCHFRIHMTLNLFQCIPSQSMNIPLHASAVLL